jgi:hypothetical protein
MGFLKLITETFLLAFECRPMSFYRDDIKNMWFVNLGFNESTYQSHDPGFEKFEIVNSHIYSERLDVFYNINKDAHDLIESLCYCASKTTTISVDEMLTHNYEILGISYFFVD